MTSQTAPEAEILEKRSPLLAWFVTVPAWGMSVLLHAGIFLVLLTITLP